MNASKAPLPLTRPRTGSCSSGSAANDSTSASGSPDIKPSKYGTATSSSSRHFSSSRASTGAENSSGANGIRQASHIPPSAGLDLSGNRPPSQARLRHTRANTKVGLATGFARDAQLAVAVGQRVLLSGGFKTILGCHRTSLLVIG